MVTRCSTRIPMPWDLNPYKPLRLTGRRSAATRSPARGHRRGRHAGGCRLMRRHIRCLRKTESMTVVHLAGELLRDVSTRNSRGAGDTTAILYAYDCAHHCNYGRGSATSARCCWRIEQSERPVTCEGSPHWSLHNPFLLPLFCYRLPPVLQALALSAGRATPCAGTALHSATWLPLWRRQLTQFVRHSTVPSAQEGVRLVSAAGL